jgi:hypothetical protein
MVTSADKPNEPRKPKRHGKTSGGEAGAEVATRDVTSADDPGSDPAGELKCPGCKVPYTSGDWFCRSCGLQLRDDSKAIDAYLAKVAPERIDEAIKARFKEQKVVEIETAAMLAERAMSWLKTLAFFIGIPALVCVAALSLFGIKTYSDIEKASQKAEQFEKTVSGAQEKFGGVQKRVEGLDESLKAAETRITSQLVKLGEQQKNLQTQVKGIQERLGFCPSEKLSPELRSSLEAQLSGFIKYLEKIGFQNLDDQVIVCVFSNDNPPVRGLGGPNGYYSSESRTINIHQDLTPDPGIALGLYAKYALLKASPATAGNWIPARAEIESGLTDYFPGSYLENSKVGDTLGPIFKVTTPYIRNLDNDLKYSEDEPDQFERGTVWGGAFWRCRAQLGRDVFDPILVRARQDVAKDMDTPGIGKKFGSALAARERAATGKPDSCMAQQINNRGLPR